jgi:Flp pilus assembly protein TadG
VRESTPQAHARPVGRWRRQPGFVREAILVFVVLSIVGVLILDIFSVYSAHRSLKDEAGNAAVAAMQEYALTTSDSSAQNAAASYLKGRDMTLVGFQAHHESGTPWFAVTAESTANTYVFRYIAHFPWGIGSWMDRQLHPRETNDNRP